MAVERDNWSNYFGVENVSLLNLHWDYIYSTWNNLYKNDLTCGPIVPCHFDMHPHNLIAKDGEIVAVLDFDSCKKIPLGYSLAFNALKQCRQFLSLNKEKTSYNEVVDIYLRNLISEISLKEVSSYDFLSLSKVEVMRRICLIFRLNLMDNIGIEDLLAAANFALLSSDDYNLACLLKSPLIDVSEDELFKGAIA